MSVALRLPFLSVPMIADEGGYAYVAHFMSSDYQLYRDIPFYRPQAIFYLYQLIFATLGDDVRAIRLFAGLYNAATVVAVAALVRLAANRTVALLSALLFALFSAAPSIEGFTANAELFAQLPIVLSAIFAWKGRWASAGLAAAAAVYLKPSGVSALLLAVSWSFACGSSIRGAARAVVVFLIALTPSVLHGLWVGWEFYWESIYHRRAVFAANGALLPGTQIVRLVEGFASTSSAWVLLGTLAVLNVTRNFGRLERFGLLWLVASVVGMAMGGFWYEHYFVQAIAPLVFLGAPAIAVLERGRTRWLWAVPIAVAIMLSFRHVGLWSADPQEISLKIYGRDTYLAAKELVDYVQAHTGPDERIFAAFEAPEIYYLARRRTSFPQMYYADFAFDRLLFDRAVQSIRHAVPDLIILAQSPPRAFMVRDSFISAILQNYYPAYTIPSTHAGGLPIQLFRRKELS